MGKWTPKTQLVHQEASNGITQKAAFGSIFQSSQDNSASHVASQHMMTSYHVFTWRPETNLRTSNLMQVRHTKTLCMFTTKKYSFWIQLLFSLILQTGQHASTPREKLLQWCLWDPKACRLTWLPLDTKSNHQTCASWTDSMHPSITLYKQHLVRSVLFSENGISSWISTQCKTYNTSDAHDGQSLCYFSNMHIWISSTTNH